MKLPETYLIEKYRPQAKDILAILTQDKNVNEENPNYLYYKKLADWANTHLQKAGEVDLDKIKLSNRDLITKHSLPKKTNDLWGMMNALIDLMKNKGLYNPESQLSNLIQKTTLEILAGLSKIIPPKEDNEEEEFNLYEGMDWTAEKAKRLKEAKGTTSEILDKFYDDYYSVEYAGKTKNSEGDPAIVTKLKSLDKILIPEFNALGYNPEVNPLAQFLKNLIALRAEDKADNIFDKLSTNNYGAIHNSFKDKYITGNMLGNYSKNNILFCKDLYNYKGLDIVNYLSLWRNTYKKAAGDDTVKKLFAAKVLISQPKVEGNTYAEKVDSLKKLANDDIMLPTKSEAKMRSALEIRELYNYLFKDKPDNTELTEDELADIVEITKKAITNNVVLEMIRHLAKQAKVEDSYKKAVAEWLRDAKYKQEDGHATKCIQILLDYDVKPAAAKQIVQKLIKHYNKTIRKEESDK